MTMTEEKKNASSLFPVETCHNTVETNQIIQQTNRKLAIRNPKHNQEIHTRSYRRRSSINTRAKVLGDKATEIRSTLS